MERLDKLGKGGQPLDAVHRGKSKERMIQEIADLLKTADARELEVVCAFIRSIILK